jgi:hypothetical protein
VLAELGGTAIDGEGDFFGALDIFDGHFDAAHDDAVLGFDVQAVGDRDDSRRARRRRQDFDGSRLGQRVAIVMEGD